MGKVIDLTKLDGAHSLGEDFESFVLGDEVKEALEKLLEAVKQGEDLCGKEGYTANNIFIDGRRGSGKTTVLLTLKEILKKELYKKEKNKNWIPEGLERYSFKVVDSVVDTSVNTASITFYFLGWLKEQIEKNHESDFKLNEQLHRTIKLFPDYLKSCEKTCLDMSVDGDIAEKLDQSDLNFRRELFKLIDLFLEKESCGKKAFIVLFMDDLDISFPPERIQKILTEIFMFLSHPKVIIVATGNKKNLIDIIKNSFKKKLGYFLNTNLEDISKSFMEKVFCRFSVKISDINLDVIKKITIKTKGKDFSFEEFMRQLKVFKIFDPKSLPMQILFSRVTIREYTYMLKNIQNKIRLSKRENNLVTAWCFSDVYKEVMNIDAFITQDTRRTSKIKDKDKANEFDVIALKLKDSIKEDIIFKFLNLKEQSLLSIILNAKGKLIDNALFWVWLVENLYFMDGYIKNFPRLLFLELVFVLELLHQNSQDELSNALQNMVDYLEFLQKINYNPYIFNKEYLEGYEGIISKEKVFLIHLEPSDTFLDFYPQFELFTITKSGQRYLSYVSLFEFIENLPISLSEYLGERIELEAVPFFQVDKILGNFKSKLLLNIVQYEKAAYLRISYFLLLHLNILFKIQNMFISTYIDKDIKFQNFVKRARDLYMCYEEYFELKWGEMETIVDNIYDFSRMKWFNKPIDESNVDRIEYNIARTLSLLKETISLADKYSIADPIMETIKGLLREVESIDKKQKLEHNKMLEQKIVLIRQLYEKLKEHDMETLAASIERLQRKLEYKKNKEIILYIPLLSILLLFKEQKTMNSIMIPFMIKYKDKKEVLSLLFSYPYMRVLIFIYVKKLMKKRHLFKKGLLDDLNTIVNKILTEDSFQKEIKKFSMLLSIFESSLTRLESELLETEENEEEYSFFIKEILEIIREMNQLLKNENQADNT